MTADSAADSANIDIQGLINGGGASLGRGVQVEVCVPFTAYFTNLATPALTVSGG